MSDQIHQQVSDEFYQEHFERCTDAFCEYNKGSEVHWHPKDEPSNPVGDVTESGEEYEDLAEVISFEDFSFSAYRSHEDMLLRPRLEEQGFYAVTFHMGEYDSFGPLTRVVKCLDKNDVARKFIYG